ncbi:MAG: hypothetical protein ABIH24_08995 [Verrucomicrobiota bacterium]
MARKRRRDGGVHLGQRFLKVDRDFRVRLAAALPPNFDAKEF